LIEKSTRTVDTQVSVPPTLADAAEKVRAACASKNAKNTQTAWLGAMRRRCVQKNQYPQA